MESDQSYLCASLGDIAATIMKKRQDGVAMSDVMGVVPTDSSSTKMLKSMIILGSGLTTNI